MRGSMNSSGILNDLSVKFRLPLCFNYVMINKAPEPEFQVICSFKDKEFTAIGKSKKLAKAVVSEIVLSKLEDLGMSFEWFLISGCQLHL